VSWCGAIITIFLAGLAISAAAIVWLSLLVRKALLLVAIVFAPLAFSGASWNASRGWISKWAIFVVALIASKLASLSCSWSRLPRLSPLLMGISPRLVIPLRASC
jgi:hypothetical protein